MKQEVGPQYSKDKKTDTTGFLIKARLHQSTFRAEVLDAPFETFGSYLTKADGEKGLNFFNGFGIFDTVKKSYTDYNRALHSNMLRSEHIGFNLFAPLFEDKDFGIKVLNDFLNTKIKSLDKLLFEYAPKQSGNYLNDHTSFDVYIEYTDENDLKCIIGIDVKFTEHEKALKKGTKEEKDILNKESLYYIASKGCELFTEGAEETLLTDKFRQVWRNQLLGERIVHIDSDEYKRFTSISVFPEGNIRSLETNKEFAALMAKNEDNFVPVTYENYLSSCSKYRTSVELNEWVDYLEKRYLVKK